MTYPSFNFNLILNILLYLSFPEVQSIIKACNTSQHNNVEIKIRHNSSLRIDFIDQSWDDYILEVYGKDTKANPYKVVTKNSINFIYKNTNVQVIPFFWPPSLVKLSAIHIFKYVSFYNLQQVYPDHSWIEINRFSSNYMWPTFYEGYTAPQWKDYQSLGKNMKVNYGIWFYLSKGSGIWVNLKQTLVIESRNNLNKYFKDVNQYNCIPDDNAIHCHDKYLCSLAIKNGYDSIQSLELHEIIICYGNDDKYEIAQVCPPSTIELRKGYQANEICDCHDKSVLLNCGEKLDNGGMFSDHYHNIRNNRNHSVIELKRYHPYRPKTCINYYETSDKFIINSKSVFQYDVLKNLSLVFMNNQTNLNYSKYTIKSQYESPLIINIYLDRNRMQLDFNPSEVFNDTYRSKIIDLYDRYNFSHSKHHQLLFSKHHLNIKSIIIETYNNDMIAIMSFYYIIEDHLINEIIDNSLCLRTIGSKFIILIIRLNSYIKLHNHIKSLYRYIDLIAIIEQNNHNPDSSCEDKLNNFYMNYDELIYSNYSPIKSIPIIKLPYNPNIFHILSITNDINQTNIVKNSFSIE